MTLKKLAVLGVAISLSACLNSGEPFGGQQNYGFVFLESGQLETGEFVLEPNAIFYRTGIVRLPGTNSTTDVCVVEEFDEPAPGIFPPVLDAGDAVQFTLSGIETQLLPIQAQGTTRYVVASGTPVEFEPGDTATIEVPGAEDEFPAWTLKAKTAEEFTVEPVATHETAQPLQLEWSPGAEGPSSRMVVSLRYFDSQDGRTEHVICELNDDGSYQVGVDLAEGWRIATPDGKEAVFTRWRITGEAANGSVMMVLSTFQVPTPVVDGTPVIE